MHRCSSASPAISFRGLSSQYLIWFCLHPDHQICLLYLHQHRHWRCGHRRTEHVRRKNQSQWNYHLWPMFAIVLVGKFGINKILYTEISHGKHVIHAKPWDVVDKGLERVRKREGTLKVRHRETSQDHRVLPAKIGFYWHQIVTFCLRCYLRPSFDLWRRKACCWEAWVIMFA